MMSEKESKNKQDNDGPSVFATALWNRHVRAVVQNVDYKRTSVMVHTTEYILRVEPLQNKHDTTNTMEGRLVVFAPFCIRKTYSSVRGLCQRLQTIAATAAAAQQVEQQQQVEEEEDSTASSIKHMIQLAESVALLVNSQRTEYLGKVRFAAVQTMAQQRTNILNDVLDSLLSNFPNNDNNHKVERDMAAAIQSFFLTDPVEPNDDDNNNNNALKKKRGSNSLPQQLLTQWPGAAAKAVSDVATHTLQNIKIPTNSSVVGGVTSKSRPPPASGMVRHQHELQQEQHDDDDDMDVDDTNHPPTATRKNSSLQTNDRWWLPTTTGALSNLLHSDVALLVAILGLVLWRRTTNNNNNPSSVRMDADVFLLLLGAVYVLGWRTAQLSGTSTTTSTVYVAPPPPPATSTVLLHKDTSVSALLRQSMAGGAAASSEPQESPSSMTITMKSPMDRFPEHATLGSIFNCWSQPCCNDFCVRGPTYYQDKVKAPSQPFLFPCRGVDLFLTDLCPEHVGRISGIMGGQLRELPTFIINYRLPWGVLLFYYEIPERFLPFVYKRYDSNFDESTLPLLDDMSPADRTLSRFLMGSDTYRDERFKIVPVIVQGPWVVKSVVGGKPAILCKKVPTKWIYQPQEGEKAMYLEADLDIVSSSAARGILSVVRSYTSGLTIDLGYTVEAQEEDELPECMLTGTRIHGIEPTTAAPLPPIKDFYMNHDEPE